MKKMNLKELKNLIRKTVIESDLGVGPGTGSGLDVETLNEEMSDYKDLKESFDEDAESYRELDEDLNVQANTDTRELKKQSEERLYQLERLEDRIRSLKAQAENIDAILDELGNKLRWTPY